MDRPNKRISSLGLKPHIRDPITKNAIDTVSQIWRPNTSAKCPETGLDADMPMKYVVAIQERFEREWNEIEIGPSNVAIIVSSKSGKIRVDFEGLR
jgi:hypothetical protein